MNHPPADVKFYPKIRLSARFNASGSCVFLAHTRESGLIITGRQVCDSGGPMVSPATLRPPQCVSTNGNSTKLSSPGAW